MSSSLNISKNDLLQVLDEADIVSECVNDFIVKSQNEHKAPPLHQTTVSVIHQANNGECSYDRPLRPLSAYNIYFQLQRERILKYGVNHKECETIPFTIQDIERVVLERYRNWAGIAPLETSEVTSKKKNKNIRIPSFGELSSQIGPSWKKLDNDTKKLFESFANGQRIEYNKINIPINNQIDVSDKHDFASLSNHFDTLSKNHGGRCHSGVALQNSAVNNMQLWQEQPNLNMMMTMNQHNRHMNSLQRDFNMAQQRCRMWQKYQAMMRMQYDSMMTSVMTELQTSHHFMTQEQHHDNDYDDTLIETLYEQNNNTNNGFHHHVVTDSLPLPNDGDDANCFDNETILEDSVPLYHNNHTLLPNVARDSSFPTESDDDDSFYDGVLDFLCDHTPESQK